METATKPDTANIETATASDQAIVAQFTEARDRLIALRDDLASEEAAIAKNAELYAEAARLHAAGGDADPAGILADSDRRRHRVAGLKTLIAEQEKTFEGLQAQFCDANERMQQQSHAQYLAGLDTAIMSAYAKVAVAQKLLDDELAEVRRLRLDREEAIQRRQQSFNAHEARRMNLVQ